MGVGIKGREMLLGGEGGIGIEEEEEREREQLRQMRING